MSNPATQSALIDEATADFIQRFVSINVATRNQENRPAVTRAAGCRIAADRNSLTIFISSAHNQTLLENLRANQTLAVVFSRPTTHRTIQFKGNDARIRPLSAEDQQAISSYRKSFTQELSSIGYPPAFCEAIIPPLDEQYVAICFTPDSAYSQTPGPNAGKKL